MTMTVNNTTAKNGMKIQSVVTLLMPDARIGLWWRAETFVDCNRMFTGHYATREEAEKHADRMYASYLKVHSK